MIDRRTHVIRFTSQDGSFSVDVERIDQMKATDNGSAVENPSYPVGINWQGTTFNFDWGDTATPSVYGPADFLTERKTTPAVVVVGPGQINSHVTTRLVTVKNPQNPSQTISLYAVDAMPSVEQGYGYQQRFERFVNDPAASTTRSITPLRVIHTNSDGSIDASQYVDFECIDKYKSIENGYGWQEVNVKLDNSYIESVFSAPPSGATPPPVRLDPRQNIINVTLPTGVIALLMCSNTRNGGGGGDQTLYFVSASGVLGSSNGTVYGQGFGSTNFGPSPGVALDIAGNGYFSGGEVNTIGHGGGDGTYAAQKSNKAGQTQWRNSSLPGTAGFNVNNIVSIDVGGEVLSYQTSAESGGPYLQVGISAVDGSELWQVDLSATFSPSNPGGTSGGGPTAVDGNGNVLTLALASNNIDLSLYEVFAYFSPGGSLIWSQTFTIRNSAGNPTSVPYPNSFLFFNDGTIGAVFAPNDGSIPAQFYHLRSDGSTITTWSYPGGFFDIDPQNNVFITTATGASKFNAAGALLATYAFDTTWTFGITCSCNDGGFVIADSIPHGDNISTDSTLYHYRSDGTNDWSLVLDSAIPGSSLIGLALRCSSAH